MKRKESFLEPYVRSLKFKVRRRTIKGQVENIIEALEIKNRFDQVPLIVEHGPSRAGYFIIFHLPEGVRVKTFEENLDHFTEQLGGKVKLELTGKSTMRMDIVTYEFEKEILFNFTPIQQGIVLPVGYDITGGLQLASLDEVYHILINGLPGGGKTNILHQWIYCLILQGCIVFAIDLMKKEFNYLREHAFLAFDADTAGKFFKVLNKEMDRRLDLQDKYEVFKVSEITGWNQPRIVLVIDELGDVLLHDKLMPEFNRLARGGRAPEVSIIAANQRNSSKFFNSNWGETRHLFPGALCFAVKDRFTSDMILGNDLASKIPRDKKGRAIWQYSDNVEVQTMLYPNVLARSNVKQLTSTKGEVQFKHDPTEYKRLPIG